MTVSSEKRLVRMGRASGAVASTNRSRAPSKATPSRTKPVATMREAVEASKVLTSACPPLVWLPVDAASILPVEVATLYGYHTDANPTTTTTTTTTLLSPAFHYPVHNSNLTNVAVRAMHTLKLAMVVFRPETSDLDPWKVGGRFGGGMAANGGRTPVAQVAV